MNSFRELANKMQPLTANYMAAARKLVGPLDAPEVVQDAFMAEWQANRQYVDLEHVTKAFYLSVRNAALHRLQYQGARKRQFLFMEPVSLYSMEVVEAQSLLSFWSCKLSRFPALRKLVNKLLMGETLTPTDRVNRIRLKKLLTEVRNDYPS